MSNGIVYFNHGTKHLARLVVSLYSLRAYYQGPVVILDTGSAAAQPILRNLTLSPLTVSLQTIPLAYVGRHACYVTKASLWRHSPFRDTLFLDADTVVVRPIEMLFTAVAQPPHLVVTRFRPSWNTQKSPYFDRVQRWAGVTHPEIDVSALVETTVAYPRPAVNTGVVAWRRGNPLLPVWESLTLAGRRTPFTDEYAMQLLMSEWPHTLMAEWYNASPICHECPKDNVHIWHFHGNKQCRPEAWPIWGPLYEECLAGNLAGLANWSPAGDRALQRFEVERRRRRAG